MKAFNKKNRRKPLVIILLGAPGSGKGTQAELLSERLNLYYLETSKILEEKFKEAKKGDFIPIKGKKYNLLKEKKLWESGTLCSLPFVTYLIKEEIEKLFKIGRNLVMAGSPRTLYEGREIIPLLKKLYQAKNIKVILLELSEKTSIFRNSHRRICELFRHPIIYSKETAKLKKCPLDGSLLVRRKGLDEPETIKVRLKEYKKRTLPLVKYFEEQGLKVKKVNGEKTVAEVFRDTLKAINK